MVRNRLIVSSSPSTAIESVAVSTYASADWTSHCAGIDPVVG